jgi:phosphopantothenoylcysteine decarboxylase/phosphopantothenate--cysteine ligase
LLQGKKILLGVTGSIAAYKTAQLVRLLVKQGAEIRVVMTPSSTEFITPLTLSVLSKNPVFTGFKNADQSWNNHIELGLWADLFIIAPASANTISKMAHGACDNLLLAVYLSAKCPVFFAPAMDRDMLLHPSTKENIGKLLSVGNNIIPPEEGELASGLQGFGRMQEPERIAAIIQDFFLPQSGKLNNKTVLINAGPTQEAIDPVRYISNHSTGKMGYALAEEAAKRGAYVILVSGPVNLSISQNRIRKIDVISASEMAEACIENFKKADIAILSAAVSDYAPREKALQKLKKSDESISLELIKNTDIAFALGKIKKNHQLIAGFALETQNAEENALQKLRSKNLDLIILNSMEDKGAGFGGDTNKISILFPDSKKKTFDLKSKSEVAVDILNEIEALIP